MRKAGSLSMRPSQLVEEHVVDVDTKGCQALHKFWLPLHEWVADGGRMGFRGHGQADSISDSKAESEVERKGILS